MHAHLFVAGKGNPSSRGVKCSKQLVLSQDRGFRDFIEQRALPSIGVAHQRHHRYRSLHTYKFACAATSNNAQQNCTTYQRNAPVAVVTAVAGVAHVCNGGTVAVVTKGKNRSLECLL